MSGELLYRKPEILGTVRGAVPDLLIRPLLLIERPRPFHPPPAKPRPEDYRHAHEFWAALAAWAMAGGKE